MPDFETRPWQDSPDETPRFVIPATDDFFLLAIGAYIDHLAALRRTSDYDDQEAIHSKIAAIMAWREESHRWRDKYLDGKIAEREAAIKPVEFETPSIPATEEGDLTSERSVTTGELPVHQNLPVGLAAQDPLIDPMHPDGPSADDG